MIQLTLNNSLHQKLAAAVHPASINHSVHPLNLRLKRAPALLYVARVATLSHTKPPWSEHGDVIDYSSQMLNLQSTTWLSFDLLPKNQRSRTTCRSRTSREVAQAESQQWWSLLDLHVISYWHQVYYFTSASLLPHMRPPSSSLISVVMAVDATADAMEATKHQPRP